MGRRLVQRAEGRARGAREEVVPRGEVVSRVEALAAPRLPRGEHRDEAPVALLQVPNARVVGVIAAAGARDEAVAPGHVHADAEAAGSNCLVVTRHGELVAEWYWNGWDGQSEQEIFSATKSITAGVPRPPVRSLAAETASSLPSTT